MMAAPRPSSNPSSPSPATPPADGRDLLTSLPDEMVHQILERLPVKDAVRTSALATPWRRRWVSCPGLRFEFLAGDRPSAVDAVLAAYACTFCELFLAIPMEWAARWIRALAAKGVESLTLSFVVSDSRFRSVLPAPLFSCTSITKLGLISCYIVPPLPASFEGFPNLVDLRLEEVTFSSKLGRKTMERLIAMSPLLTALHIIYPVIERDDVVNAMYEDWVIQAPKLTSIEIRSREDYGWQVVDLPSLKQAQLLLQGDQLLRVLSGMTQVTDLFVDLTYDGILLEQPSYFVTLTKLSVCALFNQLAQILSVLYMLMSAPKLEDLHITIMHETFEEVEVNFDILDVEEYGLFSQLKFVKFDAIMGHSSELKFLEFLVSKANLLQKVEVTIHDESLTDIEVMSSEISNYEKASSQAEVVVNSFLGYELQPLF